MFVVEANTWFLRGNVWTGEIARATQFATRVEAEAAIERMKAATGPAKMKTASKKGNEGS